MNERHRLRVCFLAESGTDVRLAEGLSERFDLVILVRTVKGGVAISHPPARPVEILLRPPGRLRFAGSILRHLLGHRHRYDVVVVQGYGIAALAANVASRITGMPTWMLVCSPAEAYYRCRRQQHTEGKPFRSVEFLGIVALARLNALLGRGYLVLSQYLASVVRSHGVAARRRPIRIVPIYGVDTRIFSTPTVAKDKLRDQLGLPPKGAIIFFSSRIAPEKDAHTLLSAVRQIVEAGREIWLLNRSGGFRAFLSEADRNGVASRVIGGDAVHPSRELPVYYQVSDVCVQASRAEGLGFSPLEALACGTPVVATATGGLTETIVDGRTGWTYPVGDADAMARSICEVLDQPEEAQRRTTIGQELIHTLFEHSVVYQKLTSAFLESQR